MDDNEQKALSSVASAKEWARLDRKRDAIAEATIAQTYATLALVAEQRTANLIATGGPMNFGLSDPDIEGLARDIAERLGL